MEVRNKRAGYRAFVLNLGILSIIVMLPAAVCPAANALNQFTSLASLRTLSNAEAAKAYPVNFEATVTYYRDYDTDLFVQDGSDAIYVRFRLGANLLPGDRVLVTGSTRSSFRPIVVADNVAALRHGALPRPANVDVEQLFDASQDCQLVTTQGIVRSAAMVWSGGRRNIYMQVLTDGGSIDVAINSEDAGALSQLLDAEVVLTGVMTSKFDAKLQQSGAAIDVGSLADVKILRSAHAHPQSLPITPMENVLRGYRVRDLTKRLQVEGIITYYQPGEAVVLQNGNKSIWITTLYDLPLRIGDRAFASGFPDVRGGYLTLNYGEVRDTNLYEPIFPARVDWNEMGSGNRSFDLVSTEGTLVTEAREAAHDEYVLDTKGRLFSAIFRHPPGANARALPPMKLLALGSRVRITGINMFYSTDPFNGPVVSDLLLRSSDDVAVIAPPPVLNIRNLLLTVAALLTLLILVAARGWTLERRVRREMARFAALSNVHAEIERRRSRILEGINGNGPLPGILKEIVKLVSFRLKAFPCWLETKDGECLVPRPRDLRGFCIERRELKSGSGTHLGFIAAAFPPSVQIGPDHDKALVMGGRLATLAMETRRLHADLVHRSEFDQLTGAHNRFSLEKHLDALIGSADSKSEKIGLIYLDLDGFKQVNDVFGHHIGDLYLEQVAVRLQSRLRAHDVLARIGGDEFAALISDAHSRAEIEEVLGRLQSGFDQPILVENNAFQVRASYGLALFPEDGATHDSLLAAADAAMYRAKKINKSIRGLSGVR